MRAPESINSKMASMAFSIDVALAVGVVLLVLSSQALACPESPVSMVELAQSADAEFSAMNDAGFVESYMKLLEAVSCLDAVPSPAQVSAVHLSGALAAFQSGDEIAATFALHAMLMADPTASLSSDIAPVGHRLRKLIADARMMPPSSRVLLTLDERCSAFVDGTPSADRPVSEPTLITVQDREGRVVWSGLLLASEEFSFTCPVVRAKRDGKPRRTWPFWSASAGAAVVAGGLWTATALSNRQLEGIQEQIVSGDPMDLTAEEIRQLGERRDNLLSAAQVTSVVTAGLGVVAVGVTIRW